MSHNKDNIKCRRNTESNYPYRVGDKDFKSIPCDCPAPVAEKKQCECGKTPCEKDDVFGHNIRMLEKFAPDMLPTAPSDWDREVRMVLSKYYNEWKADLVFELADLIRSTEHAAILRTREEMKADGKEDWNEFGCNSTVHEYVIKKAREEVVMEALERMPKDREYPSNDFEDGGDPEYRNRREAIDNQTTSAYNTALAEFRTLLSSLNQESHE